MVSRQATMTTFVIMCLAAYRLWRFVGRDDWPFGPLRDRYELYVIGHHEALMATEEPGEWAYRIQSIREGLRSGVECPWCLGAWISFAVVAVSAQVTSVALPVLQALAVSTVVGIIGSQVDD
jgi:hypothetical protein